MQFITGGAFNGKSKWVKAYNQITEENCQWFSAYRKQQLPFLLDNISKEIIVMEGLELWVKEWLVNNREEKVPQLWQNLLAEWSRWEKRKKGRKIIIIGTDITKGIVPMIKEERTWRDTTGRIFQDTAKVCEEVFLIWYGIHQKLK